jgi:hypothetical protein
MTVLERDLTLAQIYKKDETQIFCNSNTEKTVIFYGGKVAVFTD